MAWIARLLTLILVAALADAAAAGWHGVNLAFEAAVAAAVLALLGFALCWRAPWIGLALAICGLTGAFAVGTLPGVAGGPAFTGLGAGDSALLAFAVAIVAGACAACAALPDIRSRIFIVAFAAYGLAGTLGAFEHGGLVAAYAAAPLAWTRGAWVAAEIFLPIVALLALIDVFRLLGKRRGARAVTALLLALALGAGAQLGALAAGSAGAPSFTAFEKIPAAAGGALAQQSSGGGSAADAGGEAEAGPLFVPQGSADVPGEVAAAAAAAKDPQSALAMVAALGDDLYPGAIGGSVGVLRSGSGNSIDKALLLRDLLRASRPNVPLEFAECTLGNDAADALIAQVRAGKPHQKILIQDAANAATTTSNAAAKTMLTGWAQYWKTLVGQAQDESKKLASTLNSANVSLPAGPDTAHLRALAADHLWVRAQVNGAWLDLDPTIAPASPGKTRCASDTQVATLPDRLYDVLGVRVALETVENGAPQRSVLLDRTLRAADIGDRDVSFMFAEPTGMSAAGASPQPAPSGAALPFTPLLRVGSETIAGTGLQLPQAAPGSGNSMGKNLSSAISRAFGDMPSPGPVATTAAAAGPVIAGMWLELSVTAPGAGAVNVSSPIFDRVGYAARLGSNYPANLPAQPAAGVYASLQTVWNVAVSGGSDASGAGPATLARGTDAAGLSSELARLNSAYFVVRRSIMDDARGASVAVAAAAPGISLLSMNNSGALSIDIASDAALPLTNDEARPQWAAASVLAEREVLNGSSGNVNGNDALSALDASLAGNATPAGIHAGDGSLDKAAAIPPDARARITTQINHGAVVLAMVPQASSAANTTPYSFWVIDPATGTLRDENSLGRHQEMEEEAVEDEEAVKTVPKWRQLACRVGAAIIIAVVQDSTKIEGKAEEDLIQQGAEEEEGNGGCGG